MKILIIGLSVTSSWGNGHATTYRSLIKGLYRRGHQVLFLERDVPWYSQNRDMPSSKYFNIGLYSTTEELQNRFSEEVRNADLVMVGSYVKDGMLISEWIQDKALGVKVFYDIDTPVTLAGLAKGTCKYLHPENIPGYDLYLSFTAGRSLTIIEDVYEARNARAFYCSVDPDLYYPVQMNPKWDLGYLGTYSEDRQPPLEKLMLDAAREWPDGKFVVAGPQYPSEINWPLNVERIEHLPPDDHPFFYNNQKYTLNITRKDMINAGYSPSVRLFEAAACGIPVISDYWEGLYTIFDPDSEIFTSSSPEETLEILSGTSEEKRKKTGENARRKVLKYHTGDHRALELEQHFFTVKNRYRISLHV